MPPILYRCWRRCLRHSLRPFCRLVLITAVTWLMPLQPAARAEQGDSVSPPPLAAPETPAGTVSPPPSSAPPPPAPPPPAVPPPPADPDALAIPSPGVMDREPESDRAAAPSARRPMALPSLTGPIGLFHASTADVGPIHRLRVGLHGEFFTASDFLIDGDSNQRLAGGLVAGYTPRKDLELFGALLNSSNRNQRERNPDDRDPEVIRTFGDLVLGVKWILPLSPAATLGVEVGFKFLSGVSDLALSPSATSWWWGPLFTYDLRRDAGIPLRLHANTSFYADNSSNLHGLTDVTRNTKEVAMFAYGMAPSRLRVALAAELSLEDLVPRVPMTTFVEYHLAYVTSDADLDFADYMKPNCGASPGPSMPCVENRDFQWLTVGARADVYRGITVDLGVDVRIRSAGFPYGPPTPPWNLIFGVSYALDVDSLTRTVVVTRTVEKPAPPTEGHIVGVVRNARGDAPVGGAVVAVVGRARARAATDPDGAFATGNLPVGPVELEVTAANFEPARLHATVTAGNATELLVALVPHPPMVKVSGRVTDAGGGGIEASVKFAGGEIQETKADPTGAFAWALPPGPYQVRVDAPGLLPRQSQIDLVAGQDKQVDFTLVAPVANPNVVLGADSIKLKKPIRFVGATATFAPGSELLLDAVADILNTHAEFKRLEIVAHWDSGMEKAQAALLTQHQAEAIRAYLVTRGVAEGRLDPIGAGSTKPLVPNLGPANRARNRRVELHLH